jgi:recombination protein RecA
MATELEKIRKALGHLALGWEPSTWLDTGVPELNRVIGHKEKGLPFGRIVEISGWESNGKTAIALSLAALAQQDGARVVWGDVENSFDPDWARVRGLDPDKIMLIQPYVGTFDNEKAPRLSTAQELCVEIEKCVEAHGSKRGKCMVVLDSIPALLTSGESAAGIEGRNLRTNMDLPMFLGSLLRRWVGMAQVHNALILMINQLRTKPMAFGDPNYTPGGSAPLFYSHVRVRVRRVKGGRMMEKGKMAGIRGVMIALKNKSGGEENAECGFRLWFAGPLEFVPASEVRSEAKDA